MDPILGGLAAGGVIALGSGIAQWLNSDAARKASQEEIARVKELYSKINQPSFNTADLTPQDFKVVQQYVPEQARYIAEQNPKLLSADTEGAKAGIQAQMQALQGLREAATGKNPAEQAALSNTLQQSAEQAGAQNQAILQGMARRGMSNSGLGLATQLQSGADQMGRAAMAGNQQAMAAYQNRLNALRGGAEIGGQVYNQDVGLQGKNADIINAFNTRSASRQQEALNQTRDINNQSQMYNVNQAQDIANRNVGQNNQYQQMNRNYGNQMAQQGYMNQMDYARGQQGLASMQNANTLSGAADKNAAIQGVTNAGVTGAMAYGNYASKKKSDDDDNDIFSAGQGSSYNNVG